MGIIRKRRRYVKNSLINLGDYRTEAEALAVLHIKYPWCENTKKVNKDGQRIARSHGQNNGPKNVDGSKIHQWQGESHHV